MKKIAFLVAIGTFGMFKIMSQSWYPVDAQWYFNDQILLSYEANGYYKYVVRKDTVISLKNSKQIVWEQYPFNGGDVYDIDTLYLHEENSQVYHWTGSEFRLMYDFTLEKGDTLDVKVANSFCDSVGPIIIDSIGLMEFSGTEIRVQYISHVLHWPNEQSIKYTDVIYEKVGRIQNFLYSPECSIDSKPIGNYELRCYQDSEILFRSDWFDAKYNNAPCDTLIDGSTRIRGMHLNESFKVYPNPCISELYIESTNSIIKGVFIYNMVGQLVIGCEPHDKVLKLDIMDLQNGVYQVFLHSEDYVQSRLIIKQ